MLQPPLASPGPAPPALRHVLTAGGNPRYRQPSTGRDPATARTAARPRDRTPHAPARPQRGRHGSDRDHHRRRRPAAPRRRGAPNAFRAAFLARLDDRDEPGSASEAESDGPWVVVECDLHDEPGFAVLRQWEHPARDDPRAWFKHRELALATAALLPALGKDTWFQVAIGAGPNGHRLEQRGELVGYLATYDDRLRDALHIAECLIRSPAALANLLLGASPLALALVGTILDRHVSAERHLAADHQAPRP